MQGERSPSSGRAEGLNWSSALESNAHFRDEARRGTGQPFDFRSCSRDAFAAVAVRPRAMTQEIRRADRKTGWTSAEFSTTLTCFGLWVQGVLGAGLVVVGGLSMVAGVVDRVGG